MIATAIPVEIRPSRREDEHFILSSWINSARGSGFAKCVSPTEYHEGQRRVATGLLQSHGAIVACDPEDQDVIYGWACVDPVGVLHFAYVKHDLRRAGIARRLLEEAGLGDGTLTVSHWTPALRFLRRETRYDPYRLMGAD